MASSASVANLALSFIGSGSRLTALDDDKEAARCIRAVWDIERQAALRASQYNFSVKRASLPASAVDDAVRYPFARGYELPTDCLRLLEVIDCTDSDYQLEGRLILSDLAAPIRIRYIVDVEEVASWDVAATIDLAGRLALTAGPVIAGSAFDRELTTSRWREARSSARSSDATENPPVEQVESDWNNARMGYRTGSAGWEIS